MGISRRSNRWHIRKRTVQAHVASETVPATICRYEEIKEETVQYSLLMKVTQCIIRRMALTEKIVQLMKQNHIGHLEKNYQL